MAIQSSSTSHTLSILVMYSTQEIRRGGTIGPSMYLCHINLLLSNILVASTKKSLNRSHRRGSIKVIAEFILTGHSKRESHIQRHPL